MAGTLRAHQSLTVNAELIWKYVKSVPGSHRNGNYSVAHEPPMKHGTLFRSERAPPQESDHLLAISLGDRQVPSLP